MEKRIEMSMYDDLRKELLYLLKKIMKSRNIESEMYEYKTHFKEKMDFLDYKEKDCKDDLHYYDDNYKRLDKITNIIER